MALLNHQRAFRERHYKATYAPGLRKRGGGERIVIPTDVTVLERDPSPCFRCGVNGGCRHRPWEVVACA